MAQAIWQQCLACLQDELPSQQFNTWIRPLNVNENGRVIQLVAPNRFVQDWVRDKYFSRIRELVADYATDATQDVELVVASSALSSQSQSSGSATAASPVAAVFNSTVAKPVSSRVNSPIIQPHCKIALFQVVWAQATNFQFLVKMASFSFFSLKIRKCMPDFLA